MGALRGVEPGDAIRLPRPLARVPRQRGVATEGERSGGVESVGKIRADEHTRVGNSQIRLGAIALETERALRLSKVILVVEVRRVQALDAPDLLRVVAAMHGDGGRPNAEERGPSELRITDQSPGRF